MLDSLSYQQMGTVPLKSADNPEEITRVCRKPCLVLNPKPLVN